MSRRDNLLELLADCVEEYVNQERAAYPENYFNDELAHWKALAEEIGAANSKEAQSLFLKLKENNKNLEQRLKHTQNSLNDTRKHLAEARRQNSAVRKQLKASENRVGDLDDELNDQAKMIQDIREMLG